MAIDFKGIKTKYVGVTGGKASIDITITQNNFYKNKPNGIFYCFTFTGKGFAGNDYKSLQSIVSGEATQMWDRTNRNTFLGFNEETKEFIINLNGWLSVKDSDLQTVGELPHSEQAGWFVTEIQTTKDADSKFEFLQTDGSKAWLKIKPFEIVGSSDAKLYSATAVESKEKSVLGSTLFKKNDALFAKSIEDSSVVMVNDCVIDYLASNPTLVLSRDNKEYGKVDFTSSSYQYGKKMFSFETTTSINPITTAATNVYIKNQSTSKEIELTKTNNLEDILASGESLTFMTRDKYKGIQFVNINYNDPYKTPSDITEPHPHMYSYNQYSKNYYATNVNKDVSFSFNLDKLKNGIPFEMISCDTRKPFIYSPSDEYKFIISGFSQIDVVLMSKNVPSGFIFLLSSSSGLVMIKDGKIFTKWSSVPKRRSDITGTTQFGNVIYETKNESRIMKSDSISKDDLINGTGFTETSSLDERYTKSAINYSTFIITVLRV